MTDGKRSLCRSAAALALSVAPMTVFLRVGAAFGGTDEAWRRAFYSGSAAAAAAAAVLLAGGLPAGDILAASGMMLFSGALAFFSGTEPVLAVYGRLQGTIFLGWYFLLRLLIALAPGLFAGWLSDRYEKRRLLAVLLAGGMLGWSFTRRELLFSTVLPYLAYSAVMAAACRRRA